MTPRSASLGRVRALALAAVMTLSACQPNRFVSGWIPYWESTDGTTAIKNADASTLFGEVSLFWYGARADGTIGLNGSQSTLTATVSALRAKGLPVVPTIADGTGKGVMKGILADPTSRARHIQRIVDLVTANNYDGIDIDYEVFAFSHPRSEWGSIRPIWITFVNELAAALHTRGKLLSVTVPAIWNSGNSGYWLYGQPEIADAVDRLRLMVYDWSVSVAGPIAPMWWVNEVIAYSSSVVPVSKLQLGVPAYGRHWATKKFANDVCPASAVFRDSITMAEVAPLAAAHGVTPVRDASGELTFSWLDGPNREQVVDTAPPAFDPPGTVVPTAGAPADGSPALAHRINSKLPFACTIQHTVYAPDAASVRQRADAAVAAGWSGIVIWAFGYETSDLYSALAGVGAQRPNGEPYGAMDAPSVSGTSVSVGGFALDPEFDLPVPVRITVTNAGGATVATTTTLARTSRAGMPTGLGPFHGFGASYTLAPGNYTVCATLLNWGGSNGASAGCRTFTTS
ncbi:MAG: glycosyl hydrolase family 18 protein [Actinomycetota bacterium]|nr:glycosyl hydrolase family 18 protein [Actinomycetota bacterium]